MDDFLKYFEDERFVRWVLEPDDGLNAYWQDYFAVYPDQRMEADRARLLLMQFISEEEEIPSHFATELFSGIVQRIREKKKYKRARSRFYSLLRYAAVFIFSVTLGGTLVYQYFDRHNLALYKGIEELPVQEGARLILSGGEVISLNQKESTVEYEADGKIVINSLDTIAKSRVASPDEVNQLIMPHGQNTSILLPDGTRAYLNSGSRLVYPSVFRGRTREVFLMGEGYFEVAHNPRIPFVVRTNDLNITATGTRFNVSAYPADKFIETVLLDGKIILRENSLALLKRDIELMPGDAAMFNRETLEATFRKVDTEDYVTWYMGYLNFHSSDLNRVVVKLERYYNIRIYLDNPLLGMRRITGKLELRDEMQGVLEVLASTARAELFIINENTYGLK
jgi:transmembrane sensor